VFKVSRSLLLLIKVVISYQNIISYQNNTKRQNINSYNRSM